MAKVKVFLSPSTQEKNPYAGGGNEEQYMRLVCDAAAPHLRNAGVTVKIGGTESASKSAADSNAWGAALHVAVHSNAFDGKADGTITFFYPTSADGKRLAQAVQDRIAPFSPGSDYAIQGRSNLVELSATKAIAILTELAFHDNPTEAAHIRENYAEYGRLLALGILDYLGIASKDAPAPTPKPKTKPAPVAPAPSNVGTVKVGSAGLRVRAGAGTGYRQIGSLFNGAKVEILGRSGEWLNVRSGNTVGWVHGVYVAQSGALSDTFKSYLVQVSVDVLRVRRSPSTASSITTKVRRGEVYTIVGESSGPGASKWLKLKSGAGWISADYVKRK